ncbi:MAG: hypothetical protein ACQGVK_06535 [Myxococcota bacterium]
MTKWLPGLAVAAALTIPAAASAVAPNGTFVFEGSGDNAIYVLSEDADLNFFGIAALCGKRKLNENGKYKGKCDADLTGIGSKKAKVKGKLERKDGKTVLKESLKANGKVTQGGVSVKFDWKWVLKITLPDGSDTATYKWEVKGCGEARGQRQCSKSKESEEVSAVVFDNVAVLTDWTLTLDITTNAKNKIRGTALIETDSGKQIELDVKGTYDPDVDTSKIKLKNKKGSSVKLTDATLVGDDLVARIVTSFLGNQQAFDATGTAVVE